MKKFVLRPYQEAAVNASVSFFLNTTDKDNALVILPTAAGKSVVVAEIANRLNSDVLVFCPSKELVQQNYEKMLVYTDECSTFCASVGKKRISKVTFATIKSAINHPELFHHFKYVIIDEAHFLNSKDGQYVDFFQKLKRYQVLGLTATPYRLTSDRYYDIDLREMRTKNSRLTMLTNEDKPFFKKIIFHMDACQLEEMGYVMRPQYYLAPPKYWNENKIFTNTSGAEYSESSVKWMMDKTDHTGHTISICRRLLKPTSGIPRNGILVFAMFVEDAERISNEVDNAAYVCGTTTKTNRERILQEFRDGKLKVLVNVSCFTTGLDIPSLDTIVIARPTMSLALYTQMIGRAVRLFKGKNPWIVDTCNNYKRFGSATNLRLMQMDNGTFEMFGYVKNKWKQLTGVLLDEKKEDKKEDKKETKQYQLGLETAI